jgi:hypothetical protein
MFLLKRLPSRRLELLFSLLLLLGCYGLIGLLQKQHTSELAFWLALLTLELLLPLVIGVLAAGLLAGDTALDILLTAHRPAWQVLAERLLFLTAVGVLTGGAGLLLSEGWGIMLPKDGVDRIFIWLSPMAFCLGLSSAVALLRGRMLDGILATMGMMGLSLIMLPLIPRGCAGNPAGTACAWWLASPIMTLGNAADAFWPLNRLTWLGAGLALLAISYILAQREEPLLHEVSTE